MRIPFDSPLRPHSPTLSMAASSFLLPSLSSQIPTISSSKPHPGALALSSLSLCSSKPCFPIKSVSFPSNNSFPVLRKAPALDSAMVLKVALSSDVEQEEDAEYSPDLKLFVGNLPFSVDSAQLAGLFQRAGNVEMVEVWLSPYLGNYRLNVLYLVYGLSPLVESAIAWHLLASAFYFLVVVTARMVL